MVSPRYLAAAAAAAGGGSGGAADTSWCSWSPARSAASWLAGENESQFKRDPASPLLLLLELDAAEASRTFLHRLSERLPLQVASSADRQCNWTQQVPPVGLGGNETDRRASLAYR